MITIFTIKFEWQSLITNSVVQQVLDKINSYGEWGRRRVGGRETERERERNLELEDEDEDEDENLNGILR